jgi:hypothetical protein
MEIKSIYRHLNYFTKEWIEDVCTIVEEKGNRCVIEIQVFFNDRPPLITRKTVQKKSVKHYQHQTNKQDERWKKWSYFY